MPPGSRIPTLAPLALALLPCGGAVAQAPVVFVDEAAARGITLENASGSPAKRWITEALGAGAC